MNKNEPNAAASFINSTDFSQKSISLKHVYAKELLNKIEINGISKMEKELVKLKRIHALNIQINNLIIRTKDRKKLFEEVCNIAVTYGHFKMSWISDIDEKVKIIKPICWSGFEMGYLSEIKKISILKNAFGNGPSGVAIRLGKVAVCNNIACDEMMKPWRDEALKRGYLSSIALPIIIRKKTIGTFNLYSDEVNFFSMKEEVELLENITENIAFSLESMLKVEEKNKAEEAIIISEQRYRSLFEQASDAIMTTDLNGNFIDVNDSICKMLGYSKENLIGQNLANFIDPNELIKNPVDFSSEISGNQIFSNRLMVHKNGSIIAVEANVKRIDDQILLGIVRDVTERKKAEDEILKINEWCNLVAKATNDSIWDLNILTGEITRTGDGFELLFGHSTEGANFESTYWKKLIHPEDLKLVKETQESAFQNINEFNWTAEYRFLKANGDYAYVNDRGFIVRNEEGKAIRMIGATRDVSERKKHVEAIENQNRKLLEIAWVQSHVVRAPLSRMMGIVNVLKEEELNSEEFKTWVDHFVKSSIELDAIIKNISNKTDAIDLSAS